MAKIVDKEIHITERLKVMHFLTRSVKKQNNNNNKNIQLVLGN